MKKDAGARVGIDIGSCAIKIIQRAGPDEKPELAAAGYRDIAGISGTEISDALKSLADESRISSKDARISISGPSAIVRFISLPKMDMTALRGAIRYEAEKFIPYNISDCIIDFQTLRNNETENKLNILLVAAKKNFVQSRIKAVEKAGFSVSVVDVDSFALVNSFLAGHRSISPDRSYAILNVGGTFTNISILKADSICFARDISLGGNDFTAAIAKKFAIDQKAAEEQKQRPPEENSEALADCLKGAFNDLLDEIKLSFGYYENQAGKGIDEIYISGGGAKAPGFEEMFKEVLGSKPAVWNPLECFGVVPAGIEQKFPGRMKDSFAVAAGLALR